jgi:membrane protein implicated in regulation of membrane protease activity
MSNKNEPPEENNINIKAIAVGIVAVIGAIFVLAACPLAIIWAINGLFNLEIPYDFFHWSCAAVLLIMLRADLSSPSKSE